jgi:protein-S-isoprenylcysteine O-methyltransferase Ste14
MTDLFALVTIMIWPVVPLFWIPVHGFPQLFRRLGKLTYIMPAVLWPPLAYLIFANRTFFLYYKVDFPLPVRIAGIALLVAGTALHIRTGVLLSLRGLMGLPEISPQRSDRLVTEGVFSVVRHPTYLAHTLLFAGAFLFTSVAAVGVVTFFDVIIINVFVIPLEERELVDRFGGDYIDYRKRVPRYFPGIGKK